MFLEAEALEAEAIGVEAEAVCKYTAFTSLVVNTVLNLSYNKL